MRLIKFLLKIFIPLSLIAIFILAGWVLTISRDIDLRIKDGWFPPSVEVYAEGENLQTGSTLTDIQLKNLLTASLFNENSELQSNNTYRVISKNECFFNLSDRQKSEPSFEKELIKNCFLIKVSKKQKLLVTINITDSISQIYLNSNPIPSYTFPAFLIAQYFGDKPFLRTNIKVGDAPIACLQAVTSVEDNQFLEHSGISIRGILRAVIKNIRTQARTEGASTITQQLIKNYFLTADRTYKRKFKEIVMAVLLELKIGKDEILSNYLNVIYLGQSGPFQIRGYSAAAKYYFQKNISHLNLQECALIAAIVNSPGRYNPFKNPVKALSRRTKVLSHMLKESHITYTDFELAKNSKLPTAPIFMGSKSSSYFLDAVSKKLTELNINKDNGLKIYSTLSPFRQIEAQKSVLATLKKVEANNKNLKNNEIKLQASLLNIDVKTGHIRSIIGGRNFQSTQFNRALESKRQVGSIMKPFVYIAALENKDNNGDRYNALTPLKDELITYKYEGQTWTPKNYSRTYQGNVPLFYALKNSLNAPTAFLGMELGIETIIETAMRLGITSPLKPFPSLTLGALELEQMELAQAYTNIANLGQKKDIKLIYKITDLNNNTIYEDNDISEAQLISKDVAAQVISILKQTAQSGTARSLKSWRKFIHPIAGKTGTTNNTKDAWFVGFTADNLTIIWVGHDKNLATGLTGASGALPIWSSFMKKVLPLFPMNSDFAIPENLKTVNFSKEDMLALIPEAKDHELFNTQLLLPIHLEPFSEMPYKEQNF